MDAYENRVATVESLGADITELPLQCEGFCKNNHIFIKKDLTTAEKNCVLAEEIAHYLYTAGDIMDQSCTVNRKLERFARRKAYEEAVPFEHIVSLLRAGEQIYDVAEIYDFTEDFLRSALEWYISRYGKV